MPSCPQMLVGHGVAVCCKVTSWCMRYSACAVTPVGMVCDQIVLRNVDPAYARAVGDDGLRVHAHLQLTAILASGKKSGIVHGESFQ